MKVVRLEVRDVQAIIEATIEPNEHANVVGGPNEAGKTTLLNSVVYAIKGKRVIPERPVRDGAEDGKILLDLGDLVIRRTFRNGRTALKVTNPDGSMEYKQPQKMLDRLFGHMLDPKEFVDMEPKKRLEKLRELVGLDFEALDEQRKRVYDERTAVNRELATARARLDGLPWHEGVPDVEISIQGLVGQLEAAEKLATIARSKEDDAAEARRLREDARKSVELAQQNVAKANALLASAEEGFADSSARVAALEGEAERAEDAVPDVSAIRESMAQADAINGKVRDNVAYQAELSVISRLESDAAGHTTTISRLDDERTQAIAAARFPIRGLGFDDATVTFEGIPWEQLSWSRQLKISFAIMIALNPELRVAIVREGAAFDDDSLELVLSMCREHDVQAFVERVGDGAECSIIIEDGRVAEVRDGD